MGLIHEKNIRSDRLFHIGCDVVASPKQTQSNFRLSDLRRPRDVRLSRLVSRGRDGSGEGWTHYCERGALRPSTLHPDFWPDVSEYEKTYATVLTNHDGSVARVFSSWDQSTTDLHFRWMRQYGIDGVFVQRFFGGTRSRHDRLKSRVVLEHTLQSSRQYNRAIAVMYDLSGLAAEGEDCSCLIQDWKELVDDLHITSQGTNQTYLYHRGKPLVAIWGLGFPDRPCNIRNIGMGEVLDFLKNDPH